MKQNQERKMKEEKKNKESERDKMGIMHNDDCFCYVNCCLFVFSWNFVSGFINFDESGRCLIIYLM